jgi:assimilatory nitrate reductase electron transfer subunit
MTGRRVVVVGAGMVGHRLAEELVRRTGDDVRIDLVGAEEYEPYNRILLTEVLAGRCDLRALALPVPDPTRVALHRGVAATRIDRAARTVLLDDGRSLPYTHLVLATGARAFVPPLEGLQPSPPRHVHVLRTLDDCRDVAARSVNAKHAVVLGGGVLGLEAACGLRRRGVPVTVVDVDGHLMAAQLDEAPARVLASRLGELGVDVMTGTSVTEVLSAYDELVAVRLTDGRILAADLMLVSCGVRAETGLAADAGLAVDRGIVVDASLATADPAVWAVGDCARPPSGTTGLLAPGWRQAERLATTLAQHLGELPPPPSPAAATDEVPEGVKLKAVGVDLVTMGVRASGALPDDRVLTLADPRAGRHVDLVVRRDRLAGVTCLGAPAVAASLTVAFERGTTVPADPCELLLPERRTAEATPVRMPGGTTVCRCNGVTKKEIVSAWEDGATDLDGVAARTRATTGCGGCRDMVCGLLDWLGTSDPSTPDASQPAATVAEKAVARP